MRVMRTAFTLMIEKECPHCGSKRTADSEGKSQVPVAYCDTCGHCEDKYVLAPSIGRWAILMGQNVLTLEVHDGWFAEGDKIDGMTAEERLKLHTNKHPNKVVLLVYCKDGNG